jgi:hypothetical protein
MNNIEFKEQIKSILKQLYGKQNLSQNNRISLDLPNEKFFVLSKFPELKETIVNLLTNQFEFFIKEIQWVAPRPTMFKIILNNEQYFYLSYNTRSWIAQVDGKKYYLSNLKEEENACDAISNLLKHGNRDLPEDKIEEEPNNKEESDNKELESEQ